MTQKAPPLAGLFLCVKFSYKFHSCHTFKAKAFEYYKENIKKHPDHADSYFNLGRIAYEQSDYKQAIKLLQRANDLNPRYSDTQYLLGMAYIKSRNLSQGCFYLNMAKDNGNTSAESAISSYCEQKTEEETEE